MECCLGLCFVFLLDLIARLILLTSFVLVPVDFANSAVPVTALLTREHGLLTLMDLTRLTTGGKAVSVVRVAGESCSTSKAGVLCEALRGSKVLYLVLLEKGRTLRAGDLVPHLRVDFNVEVHGKALVADVVFVVVIGYLGCIGEAVDRFVLATDLAHARCSGARESRGNNAIVTQWSTGAPLGRWLEGCVVVHLAFAFHVCDECMGRKR